MEGKCWKGAEFTQHEKDGIEQPYKCTTLQPHFSPLQFIPLHLFRFMHALHTIVTDVALKLNYSSPSLIRHRRDTRRELSV